MSDLDLDRWEQAQAWATELAPQAFLASVPGGRDRRATAGILAVTAYALARRHQLPHVRNVGLDRLIVPLFDHDHLVNLVTTDVPSTSLATPTWSWLTAPQPIDEFGEPADLTARGSIGYRTAPKPLLEIYLLWAGGAVDTVLTRERGGWPSRTRVRVTGGRWVGSRGRIDGSAWRVDDDRVNAGAPLGYMVTVHHDNPHQERILTEHLTPDEPA